LNGDDLEAGIRRSIVTLAGSGDPGQLRFADAVTLWLNGKDSVKLEDALGVAWNWRSANTT